MGFYYDPYDWSFPPDLILRGTSIKPSLSDIGLDNTWDYQDPSNLSKVLSKISRMLQVALVRLMLTKKKFALERHDFIEHLSLLCGTKHSMGSVNASHLSKTNGSKSNTAVFMTMRLGTSDTFISYARIPSCLGC